ncbi:ABC transporter permease [Acuticoccus mangrovi]|uniref:ABC transporter permease n=1 Tax=Acuticoccus mangrovi TaxID=2796142 RepID=A0A934IMK1_9HYPH|nr:ABC transporter permease [Acuticoccus mangrovi]MBJ3775133.1 ABC transporter permease [Acuticoccus mangrovi]
MNLALKDIAFSPARFALTVAGVAFLITAAVGMIGLYRGIVADALMIVDSVGADLWVVQGERNGPFSEASSIPANLDRRVEGVPGVASVRRFIQISQQFDHRGRSMRASIVGIDRPGDDGAWISLLAGRRLAAGHYEAIVDESVGLSVGDTVRLARDDYTIVGVSRGMVDMSGDGMMFVTINDAMTIAARRTGEEARLARARAVAQGLPALAGESPQAGKVSAVLVRLRAGADPAAVAARIAAWGDVSVLSRQDQRDLLLNERLWRLRVQILAFTVVLLVVMTIVISLIIYTMTIEKLHQIAMLKLMGARSRMIVMMIAQQAALIGLTGYAAGLAVAALVFPYFPRRVAMEANDLGALLLAVAVIVSAASLVGIHRALQVRAQEVLA